MNNKVYLIGAGPGDEGLITKKGLDILRRADVVVYDRLANPSLLNHVRKDAELIYVGKENSNHTLTQDEINQVIVDKAKEGFVVARLKGGDPYVFGRGGEEGEYLLENDLDFEVVPGITSAIGGLAYAGIPITHRDHASSFHVFTGHFKSDDRDHNWEVISKLEGTLVFLMGLSNLKNITNNLINNGVDPNKQAAVIMEATRPTQRVVTGTVETIFDIATENNIKSPALVVIGGVVGLHGKLSSPLDGPLRGKSVLVTRARAQSSDMVSKLSDRGARVFELPSIKINETITNSEFEICMKNFDSVTHLIFTSVNGVKIFMKNLFDLGKDSRSLFGKTLVTIGPATNEELRRYGLVSDIIPEKYVAEEVYKSIENTLTDKSNVLIPRAKNARSFLPEMISKHCKVEELLLYSADPEELDEDIIDLIKEGSIDYVTFASSSTVRNFVKSMNDSGISMDRFKNFVSIGPVTSKTLQEMGINDFAEADEYTIDGIIKVIEDMEAGAL